MTVAHILGKALSEISDMPADELALWLGYIRRSKRIAEEERRRRGG